MSIYEGTFCRCCASDGPSRDLISTYNWMGEEEVYADMLRECFDITMETGEEEGICAVCITQLRNAFNFKKQVLHTEKQFRSKLLSKDKIIIPTVKLEVEQNKTSDSETDMLDTGADQDSDYEMPIKEEDEEDDPPEPPKKAKRPRRGALTATVTSKAKKVKKEGESSKSTRGDGKAKIPSKTVLLSSGVEFAQKIIANLKNILYNSNASLIRTKEEKGYYCCLCPKVYPTTDDLKTHFITEHRDPKKFSNVTMRDLGNVAKLDVTNLTCRICDKNIEDLDELKTHLSTKHNIKLYKDVTCNIIPFKFDNEDFNCALCGAESPSFRSLQMHTSSHFRNFVCKNCDAGFMIYRNYTQHTRLHKETDHGLATCKICLKTYSSELYLRYHYQVIHLGVKKNKCRLCPEKFANYDNKLKHMRLVHGFVSEVECNACDRKFLNQRKLNAHIKKYHLLEKKHQCKLCPLKFFEMTTLKDHMITHVGNERIACSVAGCGRTYNRRRAMLHHVKRNHPAPTSSD